jgi:hypothetical protein
MVAARSFVLTAALRYVGVRCRLICSRLHCFAFTKLPFAAWYILTNGNGSELINIDFDVVISLRRPASEHTHRWQSGG